MFIIAIHTDVYNSNLCVFIVCSLIHKPRKPVTRSKKLLHHHHLISLIVFCFCNALQEKMPRHLRICKNNGRVLWWCTQAGNTILSRDSFHPRGTKLGQEFKGRGQSISWIAHSVYGGMGAYTPRKFSFWTTKKGNMA